MSGRVPDWRKEPVFVLTSDTDWASEFAIDRLIDFTIGAGITPTVFVTHRSARLDKESAKGSVELGIHPNFLPDSSHGADVDAVVAHVLALAPGTRLWRSHAFVDGTHVALKLHAAGIRIDSNICLYMQQNLMPLEHWVGIRRFPLFWEDDVHWHRSGTWDFAAYRDAFFSPGLKVINVHPFIYALNIPSESTYQSVKNNITKLDAESAGRLRWAGPGPAHFLTALADAVRAQGLRWHTLTELAALG